MDLKLSIIILQALLILIASVVLFSSVRSGDRNLRFLGYALLLASVILV